MAGKKAAGTRAEAFGYVAPEVEVEIYGVKASRPLGDVAMFGAVDEACRKIASLDPDSDWSGLSESLRGFIRAAIGDEAYAQAFADRPANVIEEMNCLAYIRGKVNDALEESGELSDAIKRLMGRG